MPLKTGALAVLAAGSHEHGRLHNGQHIRPQNGGHGSVSGLVASAAEAGIQISPLSLRKQAGIKLGLVSRPLAEPCPVLIMHIAVKLVSARRRITHRNGNHADMIQHIVEIIPAVRTNRHIRRIQAHFPVPVQRIRRFRVDHSLIAPVPQIVLRCGPADIIPQTEHMPVVTVMGAIDIHPPVKDIRLPIRDIFPGRKIGIESLPFAIRLHPPDHGIAQKLHQRLFLPLYRHRSVHSKHHLAGRFLRIRAPGRHGRPVTVRAVGIPCLYEIRPIITHLPGQIVMLSLKRPPAFCQSLEKEPQVHGVEGSRMIPPRNIRRKLIIIVVPPSALFLPSAKNALYRAFQSAYLSVPSRFCGARLLLLLIQQLKEPAGIRAENFLRPLLKLFPGIRLQKIREFILRVSCHHRHIRTFSFQEKLNRIPGTKPAVLHRCHPRMRVCILGIFVTDIESVQLPCLLQSRYAEERKEILAGLLRFIQGSWDSHACIPIRASDHCAHDHGSLKKPEIFRTDHLAEDASSSCRLPRNRDILRISPKGADIADHPFHPGLLVQAPEIGRGFRLFPGKLRMSHKSKHIDPVVHRQHHHASACKPLPVKLHLGRITPLESASVKPHKHRLFLLFALSPGPHIQVQTILIHGRFRIHMPLSGINIVRQSRHILHGYGRKPACIQNPFPVFAGPWRSPSVLSHRRRRKRNPLKGSDPRIRRLDSPDPSVFCFRCSNHFPSLFSVKVVWQTRPVRSSAGLPPIV